MAYKSLQIDRYADNRLFMIAYSKQEDMSEA